MKNVCTLFIFPVFLLLASGAALTGQNQSLQIIPDLDTLYVCAGEDVQLEATNANTFRWTPANIFDNPTVANPRVVNLTEDTWVVVESVVNGSIEFDSILLRVVNPSVQISASTDAPICRGETVELTAINNVEDQGLSWSPVDPILAAPDSGTITVKPDETTTFIATLEVQGCTEQATFTVDLRSDAVTISNPDTVFLCKGDEVDVSATTSTGTNAGFRWFSDFGSIATTDLSFTITPTRNVTIFTELVTDNCVILDSTYIQIDSLPSDLRLTADPEKDAYCRGDLVTLTSPTYEPFRYPDMIHQWEATPPEAAGFETPDTLYNMVFTAQDTALFQRTTINNGCRDTSELFIPVIPPKMITITPDAPILCPGASVQLVAEFEGEGEIEWMPTQGLSCMDCPDPVATPTQLTTTYTITVTEEDCPSSQSVTVQVLPPPITLNGNLQICAGDPIQLATTANQDAGATFEWREAGNPEVISTDPFFTPSPMESTTYVVTAQYPDCDPITIEAPVEVVQVPQLTVDDDFTACPGDTATISAQSTLPEGVQELYQWTVNGETRNGASIDVILDETTTIDLIYIYGPGCTPLRDEVVVTVLDAPTIEDITVNPESAADQGLPLGESLGLMVVSEPAEPANVTYSWTSNGMPIGENAPSVEDTPLEDPTTYEVTITTADGCTVTREISINVTEPRYDIPNAFSPNDDDVNDFFNLVFVGAVEVTDFRIYNRWGNLVYDNDTPDTGWDGTVDGDPAPSDVYVYRMVIEFPDGREFTEQGEVTLIR